MEETKQKVFTNLVWRFAERVGAKMVQLIVSIILARILAPEEYGTVAIITVFITIMQVFVDSGLGNALIQKKDADDLDFSTVFYTNIVFCLILYGIIFFISPIIANFYNNPSLVVITRVLSITIIISGLKNVEQAYVSKKMIFKKFFFSTLIGTIGAAIVGIVLALKGFGVWALVMQQLFNVTVDTLILWLTVKWRPKKAFSIKRLKILFSFGWKMLFSGIIDTTYDNLRQLLIGKVYTSQDLAFYNRGRQFPEVIVDNINTSIDSVLFPTMSNVQEDIKKIKEMTRMSIKISIFIMAPLMMGLAFTSTNVVKLVLTEKWLPSVPYLYIFCIEYMFFPIHTANLNAIKALGRSDIFLKLEIIKKFFGLIILLSTMWISVKVMAYSLLIEEIIGQIINTWPNKKLLGYSYIEQIKDILPSIILAIFMGIVICFIEFIKMPIVLILIIQIIVGAIFYFVVAKIFKLDSLEYILNVIKKK